MEQSDKDVSVSVFARTDTGRRRARNEDAFIIADLTTGKIGLGPDMVSHRIGESGSLMAVSDGMGGAAAGEVASEMVVKQLRDELMRSALDDNIGEQLKAAAEHVNGRVWDYASANKDLSGMGATLTAVVVHRESAYVAQVGDSRAYLIRENKIKQLTRDQSLAQVLVDSGAITPEQATSIPNNVIMQALGTAPTVEVEVSVVSLCRDDYLLVCSDGLSNKVTGDEMRQIVRNAGNVTSACRSLIETANKRGGDDNITIIVAKFDGDSLYSAGQRSSITATIQYVNEVNIADTSPDVLEVSPVAEAISSAEKVTTLVFKDSGEVRASAPAPAPRQAPVPRPSANRYATAAVVLLVVALILMAIYVAYRLL